MLPIPKRLHNALNPKNVSALSTAGIYSDGGGLALKVDPKLNKRWILRGTVIVKAVVRGLGSYPDVRLADARMAAVSMAEEIKTAPMAEPASERVPTFLEVAGRLIESRRPTWSKPKHAAQWQSTLHTYCHSTIGHKPVDEVSQADVMAVLDPIWTEKPEAASRVR